METDETYRDRISVDAEVHFGKPCVRGTRVPVADVLELVEEGRSFQEIVQDYYPDLTPDDVRACVRYARDMIESEDVNLQAT